MNFIKKLKNIFQNDVDSPKFVEKGILKGIKIKTHSAKLTEKIVNNQYEPWLVSRLIKEIRTNDTVYDIGAHVGITTLIFSRLAANGFIYSFEPDIYNREMLNINLTENNIKNVKVFSEALSNKNGKSQLIVVNNDHSMNVLQEKGQSVYGDVNNDKFMNINTIDVQETKLDDFYKLKNLPAPTCLKIDIEGAEVIALEGMIKIIEENHPKFFIETHNIENAIMSFEILNKHEYRYELLNPKSPRPIIYWY